MILNAISGFSASMRPEDEGLKPFLDAVLEDMPDKPHHIDFNFEYSSRNKCVEDSIRWMNTVQGNKILLVGKSMGGVKTWWMIYHYWQNVLARFNTNPDGRLGVVLIDPHGWQLGDGRVGSYGLEIDAMESKSGWHRDDVRIRCMHQSNRYPKGAHIETKDTRVNIKLGAEADHWNVEDFNTPTGKFVAEEIQNMIRWLHG